MHFGFVTGRTRLTTPFTIVPGVTVPADEYEVWTGYVNFNTYEARPLNFGVGVLGGDYWGGRRFRGVVGLEWQPGPYFTSAVDYSFNDIDLPNGSFDTHVLEVQLNVNFTPRLTLSINNQWDSLSDQYGINGRFRWTIAPGNDLFLVINQNYDTAIDPWQRTDTSFSSKIGVTFRF